MGTNIISTLLFILVCVVIGVVIAVAPIPWGALSALVVQNIILFFTLLAALALWARTRYVAINSETMAVLVKMETDADLLNLFRQFNQYSVWYGDRLKSFAVKPEDYIGGKRIDKSEKDIRVCRCNCTCLGSCGGEEKCKCTCDLEANRKLKDAEYQEVRRAVQSMMNWNEMAALGIEKGAYRDAIYRSYWRSTYVGQLVRCAGFIHGMRTLEGHENPKLYIAFERQAFKWANKEERARINVIFGRDAEKGKPARESVFGILRKN